MTIRTFNIAGHGLRINFCDEGDSTLLPSFAPFIAQDANCLVLDVTVDNSFSLDKGSEIGVFDCGGADFGVYLTAAGEYQYEINSTDGELCCVMQASAGFSTATVSLVTQNHTLRSYGLNNAVMIAYTFAAVSLGTLMVHASVVCNNSCGYMFLGKSGIGKSTHSSLWLKYIPGSELMNDDNPVIRVVDGQTVVYGSPWSGKTPCYKDVNAPVGAIVFLRQSPQNVINREGVLGALSALLPAVSSMKWDRSIHGAVIDTIQQVIASTPCYTLDCRPDEEAARLSHNTISI